ncbi:hypothetical protein EG68_11762 [Paragonimus skrjabini miyazakii]|uniref:Uncharacterized protein n=1 Tax=Paragonimus skrjabini miyazakii TaxID=59628 RepID=A0A8S9YIX6_9TREM|nr:hypothetical protein EG68_11762 [Paragonimus skrjabini miyazakii]
MVAIIRVTLFVLLGLSTIQGHVQLNIVKSQVVSSPPSRSRIEIITGFLIRGMSSMSSIELVEQIETLRPVLGFIDIADLIDSALSPMSANELSVLGYSLSKQLVNERFAECVKCYLSGFTGRQFVKHIEPLLSMLSADGLITVLKLALPLFVKPDSHVVTEPGVPDSTEKIPDVIDYGGVMQIPHEVVGFEQTASQNITWTNTALSGVDQLSVSVEPDSPMQLSPNLNHALHVTIREKISSQWEYSHLISNPFEIASVRRCPIGRNNLIVTVSLYHLMSVISITNKLSTDSTTPETLR